MKKTNKLILSIGSIAVFTLPIATVISCGDKTTIAETQDILNKLVAIEIEVPTIDQMQGVKTGNNATVWEDLSQAKATAIGLKTSIPTLPTHDDKEIKMQFSLSRVQWENGKVAKYDLKYRVYYVWKDLSDGVKDKEMVTSEVKTLETTGQTVDMNKINDSIVQEDINTIMKWTTNVNNQKVNNMVITTVQTGDINTFNTFTDRTSQTLGFVGLPSIGTRTKLEYALAPDETLEVGQKGKWHIVFKVTYEGIEKTNIGINPNNKVVIESFDLVSSEVKQISNLYFAMSSLKNNISENSNLDSVEYSVLSGTNLLTSVYAPLNDTVTGALFEMTTAELDPEGNFSGTTLTYTLIADANNKPNEKAKFYFSLKATVSGTSLLSDVSVIMPSPLVFTSSDKKPHTHESIFESVVSKIPVIQDSNYNILIADLEKNETSTSKAFTEEIAEELGYGDLELWEEITNGNFTLVYTLEGSATDGNKGTFQFKIGVSGRNGMSNPFTLVSSDAKPHTLTSIMNVFKGKNVVARTYEELDKLITEVVEEEAPAPERTAQYEFREMTQEIANKLGFIGALPNEKVKVEGVDQDRFKWEYKLEPKSSLPGAYVTYDFSVKVILLSDNSELPDSVQVLTSSNKSKTSTEIEKARIQEIINGLTGDVKEFFVKGATEEVNIIDVPSDASAATSITNGAYIPDVLTGATITSGVTQTYSVISKDDAAGKMVVRITLDNDTEGDEQTIDIKLKGFSTSQMRVNEIANLFYEYLGRTTEGTIPKMTAAEGFDATKLGNTIGKGYSSLTDAIKGIGVKTSDVLLLPANLKGTVYAFNVIKRVAGTTDEFEIEIILRHGSAYYLEDGITRKPITFVLKAYTAPTTSTI